MDLNHLANLKSPFVVKSRVLQGNLKSFTNTSGQNTAQTNRIMSFRNLLMERSSYSDLLKFNNFFQIESQQKFSNQIANQIVF